MVIRDLTIISLITILKDQGPVWIQIAFPMRRIYSTYFRVPVMVPTQVATLTRLNITSGGFIYTPKQKAQEHIVARASDNLGTRIGMLIFVAHSSGSERNESSYNSAILIVH